MTRNRARGRKSWGVSTAKRERNRNPGTAPGAPGSRFNTQFSGYPSDTPAITWVLKYSKPRRATIRSRRCLAFSTRRNEATAAPRRSSCIQRGRSQTGTGAGTSAHKANPKPTSANNPDRGIPHTRHHDRPVA